MGVGHVILLWPARFRAEGVVRLAAPISTCHEEKGALQYEVINTLHDVTYHQILLRCESFSKKGTFLEKRSDSFQVWYVHRTRNKK